MQKVCLFLLLFWGCTSSGNRPVDSWPEHLFFSGNYMLVSPTGIPSFSDCATGRTFTVKDSLSSIRTQYLRQTVPGKTVYCSLEGRLDDSSTLVVHRFFGFRPTLDCMPVQLAGDYTTYDKKNTLHLYPDYRYELMLENDTLKGRWGRIYHDTGILLMHERPVPFTINYGTQAASQNMVLQIKYDQTNMNYSKIE